MTSYLFTCIFCCCYPAIKVIAVWTYAINITLLFIFHSHNDKNKLTCFYSHTWTTYISSPASPPHPTYSPSPRHIPLPPHFNLKWWMSLNTGYLPIFLALPTNAICDWTWKNRYRLVNMRTWVNILQKNHKLPEENVIILININIECYTFGQTSIGSSSYPPPSPFLYKTLSDSLSSEETTSK